MTHANEFPRPISIESLPEGGAAFEITATPEERRALAGRLDLIALESLTARGRVKRVRPGGLIRLTGVLEASVVQTCVVTLEPLAGTLREPMERLYTDRPEAAAVVGEVTVDPEGEEIEWLSGGALDLGEVVAEDLALALDPYPRLPDAEAQVAERLGPGVSLNAPEARERPFAALHHRAS